MNTTDALFSPVCTILWRNCDAPGHDACGLWSSPAGWRVQGTAVFVYEDQPCHLAYTVDCDLAWLTQTAQVVGWIGHRAVSLHISAEPGEQWRLNGHAQDQVAGCLEVDLGFTPATNLIPLRRLALQVGEVAQAPAAWLSFPDLTLVRLPQQYRRVGEDAYAYASPDTDYAGMLRVAATGMVLTYPGLWEVEAYQ